MEEKKSIENQENKNSVEKPIEEEVKAAPEIVKKQNKQLMWALIIMVLAVAILISVPYISKELFNKFNFIGLTFYKTRFGTIDLYSTKIPISKTSHSNAELIKTSEITSYYPIDFRNDPRKLNDINVDLNKSHIGFVQNNTLFITFNSSDPACDQNIISAVSLTNFFMDFAGLKVSGAVTEKEYASSNNVPYVTCEMARENTVIYFKKGEVNKIEKGVGNCYILTYKNCDMLPVAEKFEQSVLENYMTYFEKK